MPKTTLFSTTEPNEPSNELRDSTPPQPSEADRKPVTDAPVSPTGQPVSPPSPAAGITAPAVNHKAEVDEARKRLLEKSEAWSASIRTRLNALENEAIPLNKSFADRVRALGEELQAALAGRE